MDQEQFNDLRIAVIGESDCVKEATKAALESEGCHIVGIAEDADQGLRLVIREDPDVILMLVTSSLPVLELLGGIRKATQRAIVIVFTADNSHEMRVACREAGATFYVIKWQVRDLLDLLRLTRKLA
jgi:DNA-binding NarL/FixJ family response regulator